MVLLDGQAGIVAKASSTVVPMSTDAAEREYGLVVSGAGLTTYTDAAFGVRVGMAAVELVVDAAPLTRDNVLAGEIKKTGPFRRGRFFHAWTAGETSTLSSL